MPASLSVVSGTLLDRSYTVNTSQLSLLVPALYLFNNAFRYFKMGYASAIAWVIFVIILVLTLIQWKAQSHWVHYETDKK